MDTFKQPLLGHTRQSTPLEEICFTIESTGFMRVRRTELFIAGRSVETVLVASKVLISEEELSFSDNFIYS